MQRQGVLLGKHCAAAIWCIAPAPLGRKIFPCAVSSCGCAAHRAPIRAAGMVGPQVRAVPSSLLSRVFLVTPLDPPTERDVTYMRELSGRDTLSSVGFARMAQGAVSALVQTRMQVGRPLTRHAAMEVLESFNDQGTGAGFSVTFGAHRRLGHVASKVVGVMQSPPYFSPLTGWMVPEGGQ